jgi:GAF domain-containing protein/anti-sigma regulatory factor (Ser/Thr protein kinase)
MVALSHKALAPGARRAQTGHGVDSLTPPSPQDQQAAAGEPGHEEARVPGPARRPRTTLSVHDADLRLVRASHDGVVPQEMQGRSIGESLYSRFVPEDAALIESALRRTCETGVPLTEVPYRARYRDRPETERIVALSALPIAGTDGRPDGVATAVTDITEQHRARRGRAMLGAAARRIGASLDVTRCLEEVASLLVADFADLVAVDVAEAVLEGEEPSDLYRGTPARRVAVASDDGAWPAELYPVGAAVPVRTLERDYLSRCTPALVPDMTEIREAFSADPGRARLLLPDRAASYLAVPLHARGRVLGAVNIWRSRGRPAFDRQDAELAEELVSRAALGVDNARRYTRERRTVEALRRSLLPPSRVDVTATDAVGSCLPAATVTRSGGTWFDTVPLPSARVAFVVGDTRGNGVEASAATGRLRTAVRTLSDLDLPPEELLTHLHDLVARLAVDEGGPGLTGSSCLYAVYDPVTGSCELAGAGHPAPVVIDGRGRARVVEGLAGPRLGEPGDPVDPVALTLEHGDYLAFCSGNLLSGPDGAESCGKRLAAHLEAAAARTACPKEIGQAVLAELRPDAPDEDVTLLVARARRVHPQDTAGWEFPAEPSAVARAREAVTRQLTAWNLDELIFTTELAASELVTNAVRYAGAPVRLRLIRDRSLICEVSDPSQTQPRLRRARLNEEGGRGLFLVHQLTDRWGSRYTSAGKTIWTEQALPQTD